MARDGLNLMIYKTIVCKRKKGESCSYGVMCNFAHNDGELRRNLHSVWYLPKRCDKFECKNELCNMAHNEIEVLYHPDNYKKKDCPHFRTEAGCPKHSKCSFIHDARNQAAASFALSSKPNPRAAQPLAAKGGIASVSPAATVTSGPALASTSTWGSTAPAPAPASSPSARPETLAKEVLSQSALPNAPVAQTVRVKKTKIAKNVKAVSAVLPIAGSSTVVASTGPVAAVVTHLLPHVSASTLLVPSSVPASPTKLWSEMMATSATPSLTQQQPRLSDAVTTDIRSSLPTISSPTTTETRAPFPTSTSPVHPFSSVSTSTSSHVSAEGKERTILRPDASVSDWTIQQRRRRLLRRPTPSSNAVSVGASSPALAPLTIVSKEAMWSENQFRDTSEHLKVRILDLVDQAASLQCQRSFTLHDKESYALGQENVRLREALQQRLEMSGKQERDQYLYVSQMHAILQSLEYLTDSATRCKSLVVALHSFSPVADSSSGGGGDNDANSMVSGWLKLVDHHHSLLGGLQQTKINLASFLQYMGGDAPPLDPRAKV